VTYIDDLIGEVLRSLIENGLEHNTIVSLISDHGWSLGEHQVHLFHATILHCNNDLSSKIMTIILCRNGVNFQIMRQLHKSPGYCIFQARMMMVKPGGQSSAKFSPTLPPATSKRILLLLPASSTLQMLLRKYKNPFNF
jgi:hypothetical protein